MAVYDFISRAIDFIGSVLARPSLRDLDRLQSLYEPMSDADLASELRGLAEPAGRDARRATRWLMRHRDDRALHALAIASCLFDRHPCDLPPGSRVYDEQRLAALLLVEGTIVQMETGEGKTYAIALASLGLLVDHPQVVVITVNDFLARRDSQRVAPFLAAAGFDCLHGLPEPDFRGVAYCRLETLCNEYLSRAYAETDEEPAYPADAAIIIDEIDSVLLDQARSFRQVRTFPTDRALWKEVFEFVADWDNRQYAYDPVRERISLTPDGWQLIGDLAREREHGAPLLMQTVLAALWAKNAVEGNNYVVVDGSVRRINRVTGSPYSDGSAELRALEHLRFGRSQPLTIANRGINAMTLLRRHRHVVGLSGTAREDTLYYLQQLRSFTANVNPRFPRHSGKVSTYFSPSRAQTLQFVARTIGEVAPRPVVIGTWSPGEAKSAAEFLRGASLASEPEISVVTSFDSQTDVGTLEAAGHPGHVTVLSQGGSRGVDIRSVNRPLLIVLGRALEPRLDRQFLGRVGRHGEEFDVTFVIDPSSPLVVPNSRLIALVVDDVTESAQLAFFLRKIQKDARAWRLRERHLESVLTHALGEVEADVAGQFSRLRSVRSDNDVLTHAGDLLDELARGRSEMTESTGVNLGAGRSARAMQAAVEEALTRRRASDQVIDRFETAVSAVRGRTEPGAHAYRLQRMSLGPPAEAQALTRWIETWLAIPDPGTDDQATALFKRQVEYAGAQRLPFLTSPLRRSPRNVLREVRLMGNAALIQQVDNELGALRVSATATQYHRRAAFAVRSLHKLSEISIRLASVENLARIDEPETLGDLFFAREQHIAAQSVQATERRTEFDRPLAPPSRPESVTSEEMLAHAERYLDELDAQDGGAPIARRTARLVLLRVIPLLLSSGIRATSEAIGTRLELHLDSLVARGVKGAELRRHRQLIYGFAQALYEQKALSVRVSMPSKMRNAVRRARSFASTVPPIGILAALCYCAVLAVGFVLTGGRPLGLATVRSITDIFGFGALVSDRPLLTLFALIAAARVAAFALPSSDPEIIVSRLATVLAVPLVVVSYVRLSAEPVYALALAIGLFVWVRVLLALRQFALNLVGIDLNLVAAAASVITFLGTSLSGGKFAVLAFVLVGALAGAVAPNVPVSVTAERYAAGEVRYADEITAQTIRLDPTLASALLAFGVMTLLASVRGNGAAVAFVVVQLVFFGLIATVRLSPSRVRIVLADRMLTTPLSPSQFQSHLTRAKLGAVLVAVFLLSSSVVLAIAAGEPSTTDLLLHQWAGVVIYSGVVSATGFLSVSSLTPPMSAQPGEEKGSWKAFKETFGHWRQMRFAWVWKFALVFLVLYRPLAALSDALGVADLAGEVWRTVHLWWS